MDIIGREILQKYWEEKRETENSLKTWIQTIEQNDWKHIFELKQTFRFADAVGNCTTFNIKGNHYRLITQINFQTRTVRILYVLTHEQYDERKWKGNDCDWSG